MLNRDHSERHISHTVFEEFISKPLKKRKLTVADMMASDMTIVPLIHITPPYDKTLDEIYDSIDPEKPIVVYDCLGPGRKMRRFLVERGFEVDCFCTTDDQFEGGVVDSLKVYSMQQMMKLVGKINLIIASYVRANKAAWQFAEHGFGNDIKGAVNDFKLTHYKPIMENQAKIETLFDVLNDERSKKVLHGILNGRLTGNTNYFIDIKSPPSSEPEYFTCGAVPFSENECFVDGGAFDCNTTRQFMQYANNKYRRILAFEPDPKNYLKAKATVEELNDERISLMPYGLYSNRKTVNFSSFANEVSQISETRNADSVSIETVKLDDYIEEKPSFIKLDIEGSELEALRGGEAVLRTCRPKLAICLYHKPEDIWEIPLYIHSLNLGYKLYIRHHFISWVKTVLYAIPT